MGYSLSWLAVKGKMPPIVLHDLGFRPTGEHQELPEAPLSAATIPNGWYLIVSNVTEQIASDSVLTRLTVDCEAVACFVEEHVMVSSAAGWKNGRRCWFVSHNAQRGIEDLETDGELPTPFNSIRDRMFSKQKEDRIRKADIPRPLFKRRVLKVGEMECDFIFEIPIEVAREVTGFRHDQDTPGEASQPFEVLVEAVLKESASQQKQPFWKRFF
jgi:hypothetical protein